NDRMIMSLNKYLYAVQHYFVVFFFSSRRRHTRCYRDWSSDVCSSDLTQHQGLDLDAALAGSARPGHDDINSQDRFFGPIFEAGQIGRASCRERVKIAVVGLSLKDNSV